jgi:ABC-2 type transport system ATP-binding protein
MKQRLIEVGTADSLLRSLYGRRIVVRLRTVDAQLVAALRALPFVKDVQPDTTAVAISLDDPDAMTPQLVRVLVGAGADILSVVEERHSLEDVYLNLIQHKPEARA